MNRPLIISDCDEVLLHMIVPFRAWLDVAHGIRFTLGDPYEEAFRHKDAGTLVERTRIWPLLGEFFDTQMPTQQPIEGALAAMDRLSRVADIVVLTNLEDHRRDARIEQLASHGIHVPVHTNRGGKGPAAVRLLADYQPSVAIFIDDLESNHASLATHCPQVWRLHMVGEPDLAPHIASSPDAHQRIDRWADAERWIASRIADVAHAAP